MSRSRHRHSSTMNSLHDDIVADGYTDATLESTYEDGTCVSQQVYIDSGNEKRVLYLLSVGLSGPSGADNDDDSSSGVEKDQPLISFDDEPWSLLPQSVMRPQSKDYVAEIFALRDFPLVLSFHMTKDTPDGMAGEPSNQGPSRHYIFDGKTLRLKRILIRRALE